jgi:hypothetical protein
MVKTAKNALNAANVAPVAPALTPKLKPVLRRY